jgi:hypothetical protein
MTTRWSYKVVEVKSNVFGHMKSANLQEPLAQLGAQGWELVSVVQVGFATWLYMKKGN